MSICIYVYMYICIHVYMYIAYMHICILVCMYICWFAPRRPNHESWVLHHKVLQTKWIMDSERLWHLPQPPQKEASRAFGTLIATLILLFVLCNFRKPVGASGHELRKSSISNWNPLRNHRSWEPRPVGASGHEPPGLENHRFLIKILYKIIDFERRGRPL